MDNPVASQDQQQLLPLDLVEPGFVYEHKLISAMTAINPAERPDINTVIAWLEGLIEARKH